MLTVLFQIRPRNFKSCYKKTQFWRSLLLSCLNLNKIYSTKYVSSELKSSSKTVVDRNLDMQMLKHGWKSSLKWN